ncbi:MAG: phosphomannomutase/phosphoglucomutase [Candidatus Gracilibacteria bacterium]|nr:phosphomannomutase/phosphoglucomutase [Candidatus Gracilibacteria bacterium]
MKDNIFRAYDIRGLYPSEIDEQAAKQIGKAFASFLRRQYSIESPRIVVGRDNRTHGEGLQEAFISGALEHGAQVDIVEDSCSPMIYHAVCRGDYDGGCNVTASHNGPEYNGIKLVGRGAHSIAGDDIQKIKRMVHEKDFELSTNEGEDSLPRRVQKDIFTDYKSHLSQIITLERPLKIVVDAGNGIAGKYYPDVFRALGCEVIELFCEQDGSFPNHQPDPVVEANTQDLKKKVFESGADVGISFDGDGDRCAIVDEQGVYHDANQSLVLLARDVLSRHPGTPVVYTVSSSLIVPEETKKAGGKPVMVPVGHSHVEHAMTDHKALVGGEQSGHFFIEEGYFPFDDACFAAARLCQIFSQRRGNQTSPSSEGVSDSYSDIPKTYDYPEFRIPCPDDQKFEIVQKLTEQLSSKYDCETMDGVRADMGDAAWLGIRASNTSPKVSVIIEALTEEKLKDVYTVAKQLLSGVGLTM